jgi:hypothetical protein
LKTRLLPVAATIPRANRNPHSTLPGSNRHQTSDAHEERNAKAPATQSIWQEHGFNEAKPQRGQKHFGAPMQPLVGKKILKLA